MRLVILSICVSIAAALTLAAQRTDPLPQQAVVSSGPPVELPQEKHLRYVRQLTFGGENAEAYFSIDDKTLIFQSTRDGRECDQMYSMSVDGSGLKMVSTGKGRVTCGYFFPTSEQIVYSSTHLASPDCPPRPDYSRGYVWAIYPGYDIFIGRRDGSNLRSLTTAPGYDAEATMSRDGKKIVFTSVRDGDLDIYSMDSDGRNVKRLTTEIGYDGGPFFSYDGRWIVYRAHHPTEQKDIDDYQSLLKQNLIRPTKLEIWVMRVDGSEKRKITSSGAASFAPYFFPDGKRIIFSSNMSDPRGRNFDLYTINIDGTGLERITYNETFDGFPMFNSNGTRLVFASNRNAAKQNDTNIFIADWVR